MKVFTKIWWIIAIGLVIVAGLSACGSLISVNSGPSEEDLALQNALEGASWEVKALDNPPSLNGFKKVSGFSTEMAYFQSVSSGGEEDNGRTITVTRNGVDKSLKAIGMDDEKWYVLTAPELPGITYYCYRQGVNGTAGTMSTLNVYKSNQ